MCADGQWRAEGLHVRVACWRLEAREQTVGGSLWWLGTVAVVVFWASVLVTGFVATPPYSHVEFALSTLGLADSPYGIIARVAFGVLGAGILLLAAHFRVMAAPVERLAMTVLLLLVIHGVGRIGEGLFPPTTGTTVGTIHSVFGVPAVLAMPVIPFVVSVWARGSGNTRLARWSLVFGVLFAILMVLGVLLTLFPQGLGQRLGFGVWYTWLIWALSRQQLRPTAH